jgi:hypothetical protein
MPTPPPTQPARTTVYPGAGEPVDEPEMAHRCNRWSPVDAAPATVSADRSRLLDATSVPASSLSSASTSLLSTSASAPVATLATSVAVVQLGGPEQDRVRRLLLKAFRDTEAALLASFDARSARVPFVFEGGFSRGGTRYRRFPAVAEHDLTSRWVRTQALRGHWKGSTNRLGSSAWFSS